MGPSSVSAMQSCALALDLVLLGTTLTDGRLAVEGYKRVLLPPWKTSASFFLSYHSQQADFPSTLTTYHILNTSQVPRLLISPLGPLPYLYPTPLLH
jgi:hypothetical protein